ncbi:branched-chain amino acid transaminase [Candidatus Acetothermia bacterium]|nr:branched-chain amino acid transaminase [Candidatus Acetothermia bacterium]MBI3461088.1 branched-chain amino acid transaminase [Candidatus Acetothermia bacterium]MBI3660637.1 branched-chain amino acid transaminase [Candidatus Acetothermia bacterium]
MAQAASFPYAFFEGKIVLIEEAKVNIMTHALQYGTGVFGGIRGYVSAEKQSVNVFRLQDHYARFLQSLKILGKSFKYTHPELVEITLALAKKNNPQTDCYFRPLAYASSYELAPDLSRVDFEFAMYMLPLKEYLSTSKGLRLMITHWTRINDNIIPSRGKVTGGYINSSLARAEAVRHGYDDALLLTHDGHLAEGSGSNFFMVREGVLITSPKYADVLEGITRRTVLELAQDLKIPAEEREIDLTEVYIAEEAFLTGTAAQVAWIADIDGRPIGDGKMGPITSKIQQLFFDIVRGKERKYSEWLTKV